MNEEPLGIFATEEQLVVVNTLFNLPPRRFNSYAIRIKRKTAGLCKSGLLKKKLVDNQGHAIVEKQDSVKIWEKLHNYLIQNYLMIHDQTIHK